MAVDKLSTVARVRNNRVYEGVVTQIEQLIAEGRLLPGDKLPPEREIADRFGVGRNSVREAIRKLELLGLVVCRQGGGTFVTEATIDNVAAPLVSILVHNPALCSEVLDFRRAFEPQIAALAAQRATERDIARIQELTEDFEKYVRAPSGPTTIQIENDSQFHYAIACASQNGLVVRVMSAVMDLLVESRRQFSQSGYSHKTTADSHRAIFEAISKRDSSRARKAMESHLEQLRRYLLLVEK
ncbi:MAG: FadR family transcriptional regulator [Chloroflexi bacterium]|nr:FadR family transcriptional regulator [Chloroflexota bacterium]